MTAAPLLKPETPKEAARRLSGGALRDGFQPQALHTYCDDGGTPLYWKIRLKHADGSKQIRPMFRNGNGYDLGEPKAPVEGKPLYNLPELLAADPMLSVFLVEGESCCDALHDIGVLATTSGGCTSADAADWAPLKGRKCVLWADRDKPGEEYVDSVASKLHALGCTIERLDVDTLGLPEKGDAVDWLAEHPDATGDDITALPTVVAEDVTTKAEPCAAKRTHRIASRRVLDIEREEIAWLWPGRFPLGKVSLLVGDPGLGKSLMTLHLAATVSRGSLWPIRGEGTAPLGDVVLVSAEDDAADTVRPRLEAAGADLERIHIIDGIDDITREGTPVRLPWSLAELPVLEQKIAELRDCKLLVIDPVSAYLAGTDSHKNADIRTLLAPLADLAAKHHLAVVCVSHLNKSQGPAMYRTSGSLAFVAAARSVYVVTRDKEDSDRRLVIPVKANLAAGATGMAYQIGADETATPRLEWEPEAIEVDAETALAPDDGRGEHSERDEASAWLTDFLSAGPRASCDVKKVALGVGLAWVTVRRAKDTLGILAAKTRFDGGWEWTLPKMLIKHEDAHVKVVSTFAENEHLRGSNPAEECQGAEDAHHKGVSTFDTDRKASAAAYRAASHGGVIPPGFNV